MLQRYLTASLRCSPSPSRHLFNRLPRTRPSLAFFSTTSTRDTSHQSDIAKVKTEQDGSYKRVESSYRNFIQKGGKFAPTKGRYHLYVSYACPWATRTLITRKLKGLEDFISITIVSPRMGDLGWPFATADAFPGAETDPFHDSKHIRDVYLSANPDYAGRFTVPVLWDKETKTIVNNESAEIIRMLNTGFNDLLHNQHKNLDLYPEPLRNEIDAVNDWVYSAINNGVYRAGFATSQQAYETAVKEVFAGFDKLEKMLERKDYLVGNRLTEADVRLWVTLIRFDPVYAGHFKCNIGTIRHNYPNINRYMKQLYWNNDAFKSSTNFDHIKTHYYWAHKAINPTRFVPVGPIPHVEPL